MSSQSSEAEQPNRRRQNEERERRTRRAAVIIGGVVPLLIAVSATGVMVGWLPELPSPVATHWGATGGPDGFGSAWAVVIVPLAISLGFGALAVGGSWSTRPSGLLGGSQKFLLVTSLFLSGMISALTLWIVAIQRGLSDASRTPSITPVILPVVAIGLVLAVIGWFLLPRMDNAPAGTSAPEPLGLTPSERVAWSSNIRINGVIMVLLGAVVLVICGAVMIPFSQGSQGLVFPIAVLVVVVVVVVVLVGTSFWRVSVDYRGLVVRSVLGWPRVVIRRSGSVFVVTVDDAETGVSVLAALMGHDTTAHRQAAHDGEGRTTGPGPS